MNTTVGTLLVAALLVAVPTAAQRPGPGAPPIERALERRDSLGLSGEQVQQLEALRTEMREENTALRDQMRELRDDTLGDRGAVRDRMAEFRTQARELREGQRGTFRRHPLPGAARPARRTHAALGGTPSRWSGSEGCEGSWVQTRCRSPVSVAREGAARWWVPLGAGSKGAGRRCERISRG